MSGNLPQGLLGMRRPIMSCLLVFSTLHSVQLAENRAERILEAATGYTRAARQQDERDNL